MPPGHNMAARGSATETRQSCFLRLSDDRRTRVHRQQHETRASVRGTSRKQELLWRIKRPLTAEWLCRIAASIPRTPCGSVAPMTAMWRPKPAFGTRATSARRPAERRRRGGKLVRPGFHRQGERSSLGESWRARPSWPACSPPMKPETC